MGVAEVRSAARAEGRARALMVQGTMSNVGKSLLVAGLCRVLAQDGLRVVPFKSQNMALNSGVTPDGREMGRAQILQAQAAGVEPDVRMNPILLKPSSDVGSQVIVCGQPRATMDARAYFRTKRELVPTVRRCYEELACTSDVVLVEGAGSPAEINLKADDIVNMGMARMAGAPVLLVGDIDPGGVFAQLWGTMGLLDAEERAMVRGLVVNKFRGDVEILRPGLAQLEGLCGVPVVGVVPYLRLDLDDEDSLAPRLAARSLRSAGGAPHSPGDAPDASAAGGRDPGASDAPAPLLDVAVIRLPRLSNFTDFAPLERHPLVCVRYVDEARDLGRPDLLVLPGTKATMADLAWMRERGLDRCVRALAAQLTPTIGICGGYQMLGMHLADPAGVEGPAGEGCAGLGVLPVATTFTREKRLGARRTLRVRTAPEGAFACLDGRALEGYEIHMGRTVPATGAPASAPAPDGASAGCASGISGASGEGRGATPLLAEARGDGAAWELGCSCGNVLGTYLHGMFDAPGVVDALVDGLLERRGLPAAGLALEAPAAHRERELDRLADTLRAALDMDAVYRIIERGLDG